MNKCEINIEGRGYPCRQTMGAALRFKRETGSEFAAIQAEVAKGIDHTSEVCVWLWCCTASSCAADGVDFPFDLMEFLDRLTPEEVVRAMESMTDTGAAEEAAPAKKAMARRRPSSV